MSVARLLERGKSEIGCVSTGNVGTAVASLAAKAGVDAYVFYPNRLEETKARACMALGAKVCQVEGNYDEANRRCREVAEATGMEFANITLRPFYAEGAKTAAFEIVEQLDWHAPDHIVTPAAGGTLSSRLHKGLGELQLLGLAETDGDARSTSPSPAAATRSPARSSPRRPRSTPVTPETAAHSLAIGAPGDGYLVIDAVRKRGGTGGFATDPEIFAGIDLLAATEGLLTEPAGGTTIAVLEKLAAAGRFAPDETVVAIITGNGLKTLDDHPQKPWPAKIDCELDAMLAALERAQERAGTLMDGAREQLHSLGATMDEYELEVRRREERRAVEEGGGGQSEGFELAEEEMIEHTSHGDEHSDFRIIERRQPGDRPEEPREADDAETVRAREELRPDQ